MIDKKHARPAKNMSLSSMPMPGAGTTGSTAALADSMTMWNLPYVGNSLISNTIIAGAAQATGVDQMFGPSVGDNALVVAAKESAYVTAVNQMGGALRYMLPALRLFG